MKRIILNRIQTPDGTILTSYHNHHFSGCRDRNGEEYFTDGGREYLRRSINKVPYKDLTVYEDAPFEIIRESFHRGGRGKDGKQSLTWIPMNKMSNQYLQNCINYNDNLGLGRSFANELYKKELEYRKENNIFIEDEN